MSNPDMLAYALAYASRGWPVFPLVPGEKNPATLSGFKVASTDPNAIEAWWTHTPDANIGIRCGVAFDVLDVDPGGEVSLGRILTEPYTHSGPVAKTGKGHHYLFAVTGQQKAGGILHKVDFQGASSYIVAPPSLHPLGHRYEWLTNPDLPLPDAPAWLLELLARPQPITPPREPRPFTGLGLRDTRPDILEVAAKLGLRVSHGSRYVMTNCIYHADDTPSMALYLADNTFFCHGCSAHGDSHDLLHGTSIRTAYIG